MDRPTIVANRERCAAWLLATLMAACVLAGFEWDHYRRLVRLGTLPHSTWDRVVILWLLAAKTLCLLAPSIAVSLALARAGRRRGASGVWFVGALATFFWLALDLWVQQTTGNHVLAYRAFVVDGAAYRWAGGGRGLLVPLLATALAVGGGLLVLHLASSWILRRTWSRRLAGGREVLLPLGFSAVLIAGVGPAHLGVTCTVAVEQVHCSLPWNPFGFALTQTPSSDLDQFRRTLQLVLEPAFADLCETLERAAPPDERAIPARHPRPHVVVIVLESLRHDILAGGFMPQTAAWAKDGLRCERHFAGTNCSHLGIFALLFARSPLHYESTIGRVEPQTCVSLRQCGYECSFLTSGAVEYQRMNEFLRPPAFERVEVINHQDDWPSDDRLVLRRARQILRSPQPQFVMAFLMSTHFPYRYPMEYERHRPVVPADRMLRATKDEREAVLNRYRNAAAFLDDELAEFVKSLDAGQHVVMVTGDHGESHFDDGILTHWGRLSDQQCRTPLILVGPGVPARIIATASAHADVLPTLLHVLSGQRTHLNHSQGRDLLAGPTPDQAWNCTKYPGSAPWEGILVRGTERLGVKMGTTPPWLQVTGLIDADGRLDVQRQPRPTEVNEWAEALQVEWRRSR